MNYTKRYQLIIPLMTIMLVLLLLPTSFAAKQAMGDVDYDGNITAADARLVLRAAVGLESFSDIQKKLADLDKDKFITAADARLVLRTSVGLEKVLIVEETTEPEPTTKHTNHQWDSGKITKETTCAETGVKTYTCTVCKTTKTETIPKTTDHKWDSGKVTKAATCAATGVKTYTCTVCKTTKTETIAKTTNHKWDSGKVTKAATCAATGVKTYTCTVCKTTKTETIPKTTDHKWDSGKVTKAATCAVTGVKTYTCTVCKTTKTETVPKTKDHSWDKGKVTKEATTTSTGIKTYTCTVCKTTKTEIIPVIETEEIPDGCYEITYYLYGGQDYLKKIGVNNPNPTYYDSAKGLTLKNLSAEGFTFNGWYDSEGGDDSARIKSIPKGTEGEIELYARWTAKSYSITYTSDLVGEDYSNNELYNKYYVDKGLVLPSLKLDGYIFCGWSDEEGNIVKNIPVGTIGQKSFTANWISERNQAWAKRNIGTPIIQESDDVILFAYEIGEIRNVPISLIEDFGKINGSGIPIEREITYSTTISEQMMNTYTTSVSKATTQSFGWTLGQEWSKAITVDKEWCEEHGLTEQEAYEICTNEENNWYVSSGSNGSDTTVNTQSQDLYDLHTHTVNEKTYKEKEKETRQDFSAGLNLSTSVNTGVKVPVDGVEISAGNERKAALDLKYSNGVTKKTKTGTEKTTSDEDQTGTIDHFGTTKTLVSGWNEESGYGGSYSIGKTQSALKSLSQKISTKTGYGETYIEKQGGEETQGIAYEDRKSDEYVSSVTHLNVEGQTYTEKISTANTVSGYHRWVYVDTAHVFAVVGYDVATASYFVSTFSVMDNNPQRYEDYSYNDGKYEDHQNGVIPFEIPTEIEQYVAQRICESDGLEVNALGVVTKYTGTDTVVKIPEYHVSRNANGTISATKITGIDADTFSNCKTQIVAIELSEYITEIPAHTFENCSSLIYVSADGVTKIGDYAFAGCSSLHVCNISDNITSLGAYVFDGMDSITVNAANANVAKAALQSGVKEINLTVSKKCTDLNNTTLTVPASVTSFTFNGNDKTFTNVEIASNAAKTVISNATFVSDGKTPLKISSPEMELGQVRVNAAGIGLALSAPSTKLSLYGESTISSSNGRAMLCKSVTMSRDPESKNTTELKLTNGKLLLCGTMTGNGYLKGADGKALTNDKIEQISATDFDNFLKGVATITLNANGGTVSKSTLSCVYGSSIGTLPTPVWTYHTFTGWFTAASSGTKVTSATVCNGEMTLYAHWSENQWSDWSTSAPTGGDSITVETKTQYRYRNKEYKNGVTQSNISGWTKTKEWVEYGSWSGNKTTTSRPSESSTLKIVDQYASSYNYYHYCCNWYSGMYNVDSISCGSGSHYYHTTSSSSSFSPSNVADQGGKQSYQGPTCSSGFQVWFLDSVTYTYVYQTRSATTLYNHERWGDWSSWSDSYRSGQDEQTRTMYRYRVK